MQKPVSEKLIQIVRSTGEIYGRAFSAFSAAMFIEDLSAYTEAQIILAIEQCRKELRSFPTVADVIDRIADGHPGAEEAWAMIPLDETGSVVWTEEMANAFGIARSLLPGDEIGARMAFRECYKKSVAKARAFGTPPKWTPSLGTEKLGRQAALMTAVENHRISAEAAETLCPEVQFRNSSLKAIGIDRETLLRRLPEVL